MRDSTLSKVLLLLGFVGVSVAIASAHINPATSYELSIYTGTPISFWVGTSLTLLLSILVVFSSTNNRWRVLGAFLGGLTMTAIVALPILRGYHYLGEADALSHLGTAREMNAGLMSVTGTRYPVVHVLGSILHDTTGLALNHVMLLVIVVFVVCFFVFVPLVVRELTGDGWATYVGLYSGFLLLPLNHLAPSQRIHPTSQALMYAPAFLFVFFVLYKQRSVRNSAMFLLLAPMFVLLHPQQAANLVAFFSVIAALQIGYDVLSGFRLDHWREWVIPEVTYYAVVFLLWAMTLPVFWRNTGRVISTLSGETQFARSTATRSGSLAEVGGSLPEVFVKLFLVSLVYVILTGVFFAIVASRSTQLRSYIQHDSFASNGGSAGVAERMLPTYIFCGLATISVVFFVYLVGGISDQYFRHLGMLMVFATVLGSIVIGHAMRRIGARWSKATARRSIALVLLLFTALSLPVVFTGPYIYDSSNHVTEAQMSGYETTFEYQADSMSFDDVRSPVFRYGHAIHGTDVPYDAYYYDEDQMGIPNHFANRSLRSYYNESVYIPVTEADRIRDPVLWAGFRFSHEDFDYLDSTPGIDRVQTNGGYDLYLVELEDDRRGEPSGGRAPG